MPHDNPRHERVANLLQRELADLIRNQLKDPELDWVSITEVRVSKDLGVAKVYFSMLTGDATTLQPILQAHAGRLRGFLGKRMRIRHVPELRFEHDDLLEKGNQMSSLIDAAVREDREHAKERGELDADASINDSSTQPNE